MMEMEIRNFIRFIDSMNIISNGSISIRTGGNNERLNINSVGTILG